MKSTKTFAAILIVAASLGGCAQRPAYIGDGWGKSIVAEDSQCNATTRDKKQFRNPFLRARRIGGSSCSAGQ